MSLQLPNKLPVVPLGKKVLLPCVVIKVTLHGASAALLVRQHFKLKEHEKKTLYLACIPDQAAHNDISSTSHPPEAPVHEAPTVSSGEEQSVKQKPAGQLSLFHYGCVGRIRRVQRLGTATFGVFLEGVARCKIEEIRHSITSSGMIARVQYPPSRQPLTKQGKQDNTFDALVREFVNKLKDLQIPESLVQQLSRLVESQPAPILADMLVCMIETSFQEKLTMLSTENIEERLSKAAEWMTRQLHVLKIADKIHSAVEANLSRKQREFYLRQQLEAIQKESANSEPSNKSGSPSQEKQEEEEEEDDIAYLKRRLAEARLPNEVLAVAQRELKRIARLQPSSTEWAVSRNYLELVADLPWNIRTPDVVDVIRAKRQLDQDHFGLHHVKRRIIEYLSVMKIKGDLKAPILCFVGPPGVGKTSLGRSVAIALSRRFHRISLGGVRDEADMRGHRRTYVGAMPGLIIQGIRRSGVNNPVFLLDEVDKLVHSSAYGNPAAALLEVLDPEQNYAFSDHYLNVPFDLSHVLFIATANTLDTIPAPLLDRMEIIQLHGYTFEEKLHIAKTHLLPKQLHQHGLRPGQVVMSDNMLMQLAEQYTRESGVRGLERIIASVVRTKCVQLAELKETDNEANYTPQVTAQELSEILGAPKFDKEIAERDVLPGVVTGLAYAKSGHGSILFVESTKMPGKGKLRLTGSLGEVIKESAHIALSWIRAHAYQLRIAKTASENITENCDIHVHVPQGAVPKDGPSAGVTLVCSLVSLFTDSRVPPTTAMTGEVSLRGHVLPVAGIKEKAISAHRAGIRKIILPDRNRKDVEADVPESVKSDIAFVYARSVWDILDAAIEKKTESSTSTTTRSLESHL